MPKSHEVRDRTSETPQPRSTGRKFVRWLGGLFITSVRYLFMRVPSYRRDRFDEREDPLPDFGRELPGGPSTVQRVGDGTGSLYHRHFWIEFTDAEMAPDELIATLASDLNAAAPGEVSRFEAGDDDRSRSLQVGAELVVRLPGPWDGPVRVIDRTPTSFRFVTLDGHMEAGEIEFRAATTERGHVRFSIETWARSGDRWFRMLYDVLPVAREAQAFMWAHFCARAARLAGGIVMSNVAVNTERFEIGPWLRGAATDRPIRTTAPVSGRTRRLLYMLPGRPYNFDPDDDGGHTAEAGWNLDDHRVALPAEPPGQPLADGSWAVARRLCADYEFVDPRLVRAAYFTDVPLAERELALEGRFAGMRFPLGLRVGALLDRTEDIDGRAARRWGWNYRTLRGHLERGQMDFEVRKWIDTGAVEFRISAYSQRAHIEDPFVRLGLWLLGRPLQRRFARRALRRMRRLVERELSDRPPATEPASDGSGCAGSAARAARISGQLRIAAPIERVFDTVADSRNEPLFNPAMTDAELLTPPPIGLHTRFRAHMGEGRMEMLVELTEFDRPYRLGFSTTSSMMVTSGALTFAAEDDATTTMSWDWQVRPRGWLRALGPLFGPLGGRMERRTWTGLKQMLESNGDRSS